MSEILKGGEQSSSSQGSDWDMLTALANKNMVQTDETPVRGSSERFKREAAVHEANAEKIMDNMSDAQLDALAKEGIRDAQDAGEFLHEAASWKEQVERLAGAMWSIFNEYERQLVEAGELKGLDPVTGELAGDWREPMPDWVVPHFQMEQEKEVWSGTREAWAVGDLIREESRAKKEKGVDDGLADVVLPGEEPNPEYADAFRRPEDPEPRSRGALDSEAIERWKADVLGDEEKKKKVENSVFYATLKRKMQKEAEKQSQEQEAA